MNSLITATKAYCNKRSEAQFKYAARKNANKPTPIKTYPWVFYKARVLSGVVFARGFEETVNGRNIRGQSQTVLYPTCKWKQSHWTQKGEIFWQATRLTLWLQGSSPPRVYRCLSSQVVRLQ